jgi:hypothetical protein
MQKLPSFVTKYFWGDNLSDLNWDSHQSYITATLLEKGDPAALTWLLTQLPKSELAQNLSTYKLTPKSSNFWHIYLS